MKRAIHILFWLSLVTAVVVFLLRRGASHDAPTDEETPSLSPAGALPVPARAGIRPPVFITPDAGPAPAAQPAPVDPEVAAEMALMKHFNVNPEILFYKKRYPFLSQKIDDPDFFVLDVVHGDFL